MAYLRMHGRNEEKWYGGKSAAERHDYLYTPDELHEWVMQVKEREDELSQVYVMLQNTTKGHALKNTETLRKLFSEVGIEEG